MLDFRFKKFALTLLVTTCFNVALGEDAVAGKSALSPRTREEINNDLTRLRTTPPTGVIYETVDQVLNEKGRGTLDTTALLIIQDTEQAIEDGFHARVADLQEALEKGLNEEAQKTYPALFRFQPDPSRVQQGREKLAEDNRKGASANAASSSSCQRSLSHTGNSDSEDAE